MVRGDGQTHDQSHKIKSNRSAVPPHQKIKPRSRCQDSGYDTGAKSVATNTPSEIE